MNRRRVIGCVLFLLSITTIVFWLSAKSVVIEGISMMPGHPPGTRLVASHAYWLVGTIRKGDVVAFDDPEDSGKFIIKRVYAISGEVVPAQIIPYGEPVGKPYIVPPGYLYVLGDNRGYSEDSRAFGPVRSRSVIGKCLHIWGDNMAAAFWVAAGTIGVLGSAALLFSRIPEKHESRPEKA